MAGPVIQMALLALMALSAGTSGGGDRRPLVSRGERVVLCARVGAVVASVPAEALEEGREGDKIRVRNLQSARVQVARVTRAGEVEVVQ